MAVRRMKTYTGGQGYVYQYYFVGQRAAAGTEAGREYIFDVSSDRKARFSVSVILPEKSLIFWESTHGRVLSDAEQYAAVKMRLFQAFDEVDDMLAQGRNLRIENNDLAPLLSHLGVE